MEKVKEFAKRNKKWIFLGTAVVAVVGGVTVYAITKKKPKFTCWMSDGTPEWRLAEDERIKALDWSVGTMTDLWDEGGYINGIVNKVTLEDLGKFGEELKKIEGVVSESGVDMVIGLNKS